jgi:hypothetical protein
MNLLDRLPVKTKLLLIAAAFSLPLALLVVLLVRNIQGNITFAQAELAGNEFQRPLEELLDLLPPHARAATADSGAEASALGQRIDRAFDALEKVNAKLGKDLGFDPASLAERKRDHVLVSTVHREWDELKGGWPRQDARTRAVRHAHLIADLRTMITHVGDMSKLILDPDLDSFYLMDFTLVAGPQNHDRIAAIAAEVDVILRRKTITTTERNRLAAAAAMLKEADRDRITASLGSALNEDANFYGRNADLQGKVPALLADYTNAVDALQARVAQIAVDENVVMAPQEFAATAEAARVALYRLWNEGITQLDALLAARIASFRHDRAIQLGLSGAALAVCLALVALIQRKITRPLRDAVEMIDRAAEEMASTLQELAGQAQTLQAAVDFFKIGIVAGHGAAPSRGFQMPPVSRSSKPTFARAAPTKPKAGGIRLDLLAGDPDDGDFARYEPRGR